MYTFAHNIRIYEGWDNKIQANLQSQVIRVDSRCCCQDVGSAMPLWFFYVLLDPPGNLQSASQWSQPLSGRTGEKVSGGFGSRSQRSLHGDRVDRWRWVTWDVGHVAPNGKSDKGPIS